MSIDESVRAAARRLRPDRQRSRSQRGVGESPDQSARPEEGDTFPKWFGDVEPIFARNLSPLAGQPKLEFLQIGVYTGDASVWLLEHVLTGRGCRLDDVDPWTGAPDLEEMGLDWQAVQRRYAWQTRQYRRIVRDWVMRSDEFFAQVPSIPRYDFAYVDGNHTARNVLRDAIGAWDRLKPGGLLAFDDYEWGEHRPPHDRPRPAIDAFLDIHATELLVLERGWQVWVRKNADPNSG